MKLETLVTSILVTAAVGFASALTFSGQSSAWRAIFTGEAKERVLERIQ